MAVLQQLDIHHFRNITRASLVLSPGINLIHGDNGSGKTSILESIHMLGRARSFRSHLMRHVISVGEAATTVHGKLLLSSGRNQAIGVKRDRQGGFEFRLDYESLTTAAPLARALPLQVFNATSFQLVEGGPQLRRQFVDWGVFHVEHSYSALWRRFQKTLRQRNSLLRHGKIAGDQLDTWDEELAQVSMQINDCRLRYLQMLLPRLKEYVAALTALDADLEFDFSPGWDLSEGLLGVMRQSRDRELAQGQTLYGPHRAELRIRYLGLPASQSLSRGQTKALVYAMKVGQGLCFQERSGQPCLFLLDDFPAELDIKHREKVVALLMEYNSQALITGTHKEDLARLGWQRRVGRLKTFHVEHGRVIEEPEG